MHIQPRATRRVPVPVQTTKTTRLDLHGLGTGVVAGGVARRRG
ncbi:MAG: hypothetical protein OXR73_38150 [Myxococcales bacterium]|nr:hypothetical protein [Myxococcales bacterium]